MNQKLEIVNSWNLSQLLDNLETGHIKIPKFQRDYIWDKNKVVKLLNSIYHQYPIGSFFFWIAPLEYASFIREDEELGIPSMGEDEEYQFILDGQQRLISLFVALRGKVFNNVDYGTICFNPLKKEFKIPRAKTEKNNIPAWKLFDPSNYEQVYTELLQNDEHFNKKNNRLSDNWRACHETLLSYPISIIKTHILEIEDVVEIFERINQGGKHLTLFDLIHATTWSEEFDLKQVIAQYNSPDLVKKQGALSNKVFTLALTLNAFDDARNANQLKLTPQLCHNIWPKTRTSIHAALNFLKHMRISGDVSAYHNTLPLIQYYFFKGELKEVHPDHQKRIEKWFWDAKFSKRYATSVYTRIKEDANFMLSLLQELNHL